MKCPMCNAWTIVKRTSGTLRRRECANSHRFSTEEVPVDHLELAAYKKRTEAAMNTLREKGYLL